MERVILFFSRQQSKLNKRNMHRIMKTVNFDNGLVEVRLWERNNGKEIRESGGNNYF